MTSVSSSSLKIAASAAFGELSADQLAEIWSRGKIRNLLRGEKLILQGTSADAVYIVLSGRFEVRVEHNPLPLAEIGVGQPIGEIAFFAGGLRTATVAALRDSVVLELDRKAFDDVVRHVPAVYDRLLAALARRLAETTARIMASTAVAPARTVAVISGGRVPASPEFLRRLQDTFAGMGKCLFLTHAHIKEQFPHTALDDSHILNWLNAVESEYELIVYLADEEPSEWTHKAIRQADQLVIVTSGAAPASLNPVEQMGFAVHPASRRRLVRIHDRRAPFTTGTSEWLRERDVAMHHHVALEDNEDLKSVFRFLTGKAVGFVAGGGGGFGPAHIGIYKAFQERGAKFDILGGASVGAAVLGGFALLATPEDLDQVIDDIFVASRGFKRRTFPRYSLLDHVAFDAALERQCRGAHVEDAWVPYFAVATDVDRAGQGPYVMRTGPLWKAMRASASIPAVLPPMFTDDGRMLVDGGVVDNIPLSPMKALKSGPNLVVHFGVPEAEPYNIKYESIPGRGQLFARMLNPFRRERLPDVPGPISVLRRCFGIHQNPNLLPVGPLDLVLAPPEFPGSSFVDFDRHTEVFEAAYRWCSGELDRLAAENSKALASILVDRR